MPNYLVQLDYSLARSYQKIIEANNAEEAKTKAEEDAGDDFQMVSHAERLARGWISTKYNDEVNNDLHIRAEAEPVGDDYIMRTDEDFGQPHH